MAYDPRPPIVRFWAYITIQSVSYDDTPCWQWTGHLDDGYGHIRVNNKQGQAHRFSYEQFRGPIPDGMEIDHLCRNRACVNPAHLEAVTSVVNTLRGESFAARNARKTHCPSGHPYDDANTRIDKRGSRVCRACIRRHSRNHYRQKKSRHCIRERTDG